MKRLFFVVFALALTCWYLPLGYSQNLLNRPESVEYDFHSDRYFVSNYGDGNIIQIDNFGQQSIFHSGFTRLAGLHKIGNILFVAANLEPYVGVYGLSVATGQTTVEIPIPGTGLLNDIASDTSGNLYVTDFYDSKVYKIRLSDYTVSLFVDSDLGNPNGIVFDIRHNRLLTACQGDVGRPIKAISLEDSSVSVAVYTYLSGIDGLAFDNDNRLTPPLRR
jgi:sugar lactone lactonase YvrE